MLFRRRIASFAALGALLAGFLDEGELRYAGRVGTGFTEAELGFVLAALFVAVAVAAAYERDDRVAEVEHKTLESDSLRVAAETLEAENQGLRDSIAALEPLIDSSRMVSVRLPSESP
ncbi:MAG: hypothetical protein KY442_05685 [Proteobacteria bacterium]|nr:hypothetical protein [Pseudomonadota bacterium]